MLSELGKYLGGSKMRVIFMGTPDFSVGTLEAIIEAHHITGRQKAAVQQQKSGLDGAHACHVGQGVV